MSEYESDWVGGPVKALAAGEVVHVEVWDAHSGHHHSVPGIVKGKWRAYPKDRYPWHVAVELSRTVGAGYTDRRGDVVLAEPEMVSRSESVSIMPINSEFWDEHLAGLPEVRVRQCRVVPEVEGVADAH